VTLDGRAGDETNPHLISRYCIQRACRCADPELFTQTYQVEPSQAIMSSPVAELEAGLQAMLGLKPPGVSGSRITGITTLCVNNVQSESVLIQKLYTHFKKAPATHKLGVLYVVDSVTRKWMEQAKAQGQPISSAAQDGTFAAGVHRVTELMPVLMNDIISSAPEDQKVRKLMMPILTRCDSIFTPEGVGCRRMMPVDDSFRLNSSAWPLSAESTGHLDVALCSRLLSTAFSYYSFSPGSKTHKLFFTCRRKSRNSSISGRRARRFPRVCSLHSARSFVRQHRQHLPGVH